MWSQVFGEHLEISTYSGFPCVMESHGILSVEEWEPCLLQPSWCWTESVNARKRLISDLFAFCLSSHITPILRSLHWLKINERIEYKLLSLTYKVLTTSQPDYLHNLISVQSSGRTRSSSLVTLAQPSVSSSLQITNRSFRYASPHLWQ